MRLTATTITDEQILKLFNAGEIAANELTVATRPGWSAKNRLEKRARCAEIFNARALTTCAGRIHRDHARFTCVGTCCTNCGGTIDENEECRC